MTDTLPNYDYFRDVMYKVFFHLVFVFSAAIVFSQQDDSVFIKHISDNILIKGHSYENLRELTKKIGGRLAGSPQIIKAENWGSIKLKEAGADKVWLQECTVPHWVRGGKDEVTISPNSPFVKGGHDGAHKKIPHGGFSYRPLSVLALGNSIGTGPKGINAEIIQVNSFDELEKKKDSVKGKIVFYNYKFNPTFINTEQAYGDAVPYRAFGASRAAKYGAVAVIVRSMSHSTDNYPHTGSLKYDSAYPQIPAVAVGLQDAGWLDSILQKNKAKAFFKTNAHFLPDTTGHNVIGELKGTEHPDEFITVGAHLDSWDPSEGAHDDGAGVVQTIEILKAFKDLGYTPKHTIRFVLFANEENGARGGNKYAEEAKQKNEKHIFALESDAGGFTPRGFGISASGELFKKIQSWSALLAPYGGGVLVRGGGGTDIEPLQKTFNMIVAGLHPDSQRYFDFHHTPNDVFENVNKRELELGAINMAALIYLADKYLSY